MYLGKVGWVVKPRLPMPTLFSISTRARRSLGLSAVVVLAFFGLAFVGAGCGASEAELIATLESTGDSGARHEAAVDLARMYSLEATEHLVEAAQTDTTAGQGLIALRDEYVAALTSPPEEELSEEAQATLLGIVNCLGSIGDEVSVEALGALILGPDAYPLDLKLQAVNALGALQKKEAFVQLIELLTTAGGVHGPQIRAAAAVALQASPESAALLVEARTESAGDEAMCSAIDDLLVGMGEAATEPLVAAIGQQEWTLQVLYEIGSPAAPVLAQLLDGSEGVERDRALGVLLRLYQSNEAALVAYLVRPELVPTLIEARSEAGYADGRDGAIEEILLDIGPQAVSPLIDQLGKMDWVDEVLAQAGSTAAPELVEAVKSEDPTVRSHALSALLGFYADDEVAAAEFLAVPALVPVLIGTLLDNPFEDERDTTIGTVLVRIGDPALTALIAKGTSLTNDDGEWTDLAQSAVVYDLLTQYDDTTVVDALIQKLIDDKENRAHTVFLAIRLGIPGSEERLTEFLYDYGSKELGLIYLNCGSDVLYDAGVQWGKNHGYTVVTEEGEPSPYQASWGSF